MSAWFVSKSDIDLIVSHLHPATVEEGTKIGKLLWQENLKSLKARYPYDRTDQRACAKEINNYVFHQYEGLRPGPLATIVACYEYQSCEHDGWKDSEAHKITASITAQIGEWSERCGGPWGTDDDPAKIAQVAA